MRTRPAVLSAALALTGLLALGTAGPAAAHGDTIHLDVSGQADGHPKTVATWENDRDPVTERLAATLSALSADGRRVGPWRLVAVPGTPSTFTTQEALPAGQWKVTVESGFPALGRGEAEITVAATVAEARPVALPSTAPPVAAPPVAAGAGPSATTGWIATAVGAALAVLAAAAVTLAARRRRGAST